MKTMLRKLTLISIVCLLFIGGLSSHGMAKMPKQDRRNPCRGRKPDTSFKDHFPILKEPMNVKFNKPSDWKGTYSSTDNLHIDTETLENSKTNSFLRITMSQGDNRGKTGDRAEIAWDNNGKQGAIELYEWRFKIPKDYADVYTKDKNGKVNFQVMGQWHQQPVWSKCQYWGNFRGAGKSPVISLNYSYAHEDDPELYSQLDNNPPTKRTYLPDDGLIPGRSYITVTYGLFKKHIVAIVPIEKGVWHTVSAKIKWSRFKKPKRKKDRGWMEMSIDDIDITKGRFFGPNMFNVESNFFKVGIYRNSNIESTNSIHIDDIHIERLN